VDFEAGTLTIRRSWNQPFPKDDEVRTVLIVSELRAILEEALKVSPRTSPLVFPRPDGTAYAPTVRWQLVDQLRRALVRIGDVIGYDHTCRRCKARAKRGGEGAPKAFTWRHEDGAQRRCEACRMKLWIVAVPRPVRFYDLRHSHGTILRKARVDLGTVQKALGHSSPEITAGTYDHSDLEDDRETLERVLSFNPPPQPPRPSGTPNAMPLGAPNALRAAGGPTPPRVRSTPCAPMRLVGAGVPLPFALGVQVVAGSNPVAPTFGGP